MGYEIPKANWELWAHMLTATLREAVLLSLDMEPNPPALKRSLRPEKYNAPGTDFEHRLKIALSHLDAGKLPLEHGPIVFSRDAHKVKLHTFEAWARSVGWVLPESFPKAIEQAAPEQSPAPPATVVANGKKWTPEKLAELRAYREAHTMPETAKQFGISEQRIRDLLPSQKPKAKSFEGLIHRSK